VCDVSPVDGVHLDEQGQRRLGLGIAERVRDIV
jgi:lysophospholipase L1-like esterase